MPADDAKVQFLNEIQSALLFDSRLNELENIVQVYTGIQEQHRGAQVNIIEARQGAFYRLYTPQQNLMVTLEYIDQPASIAVFQQSVTSDFTRMICPDIRQRLAGHRSHILVSVSHGVFGGAAKVASIAAMFDQIGFNEGQSVAEFNSRLEALVLLTRIVNKVASARVVHWTPCNNLLSAEAFETLAGDGVPGPLHLHPHLFGQTKKSNGKTHIGMRTFGARHFIGREIIAEPSALPWAANLETAIALLRVATVENGYIIPDGDVFRPDDASWTYRVLHRAAAPGDVPLLELIPLVYPKYGFTAAGYVPPSRVVDERSPPAEMMQADPEAREKLTEEWREKRGLVEGIGGRLEVRVPGEEDSGPAPSSSGWLPRIFGRKRPG